MFCRGSHPPCQQEVLNIHQSRSRKQLKSHTKKARQQGDRIIIDVGKTIRTPLAIRHRPVSVANVWRIGRCGRDVGARGCAIKETTSLLICRQQLTKPRRSSDRSRKRYLKTYWTQNERYCHRRHLCYQAQCQRQEINGL